MWLAKLKGVDKSNPIYNLANKHKVTILYHPINYYKKNKTYYFISTGYLKGPQNSINNFFKDYKKLSNRKQTENRKLEFLEMVYSRDLKVWVRQKQRFCVQ